MKANAKSMLCFFIFSAIIKAFHISLNYFNILLKEKEEKRLFSARLGPGFTVII